jgi:hypothetical protein
MVSEIKERILCILPVPEPKELLEGFRAKFPSYEIEYITQRRVDGVFLPIGGEDSIANISISTSYLG